MVCLKASKLAYLKPSPDCFSAYPFLKKLL